MELVRLGTLFWLPTGTSKTHQEISQTSSMEIFAKIEAVN